MKLLVYGSKGWIGQQFVSLLKEKSIKFIEGTSRTDNETTLLDELLEVSPTNVVSFIGRTHGTFEGEKIGKISRKCT